MTRTDCINFLRSGQGMTHRVSRIIADMLEADGTALANAEESHLLRTLADIREALGVGAKPMLDELPGLVRGMADRIKELEAYGKGMEEVYAELGAKTQAYADRLVKVEAERDDLRESIALAAETEDFARASITEVETERDELARAVTRRGFIGNATIGGWCDHCQVDIGSGHAPGCPVALAEEILKAEGK